MNGKECFYDGKFLLQQQHRKLSIQQEQQQQQKRRSLVIVCNVHYVIRTQSKITSENARSFAMQMDLN